MCVRSVWRFVVKCVLKLKLLFLLNSPVVGNVRRAEFVMQRLYSTWKQQRLAQMISAEVGISWPVSTHAASFVSVNKLASFNSVDFEAVHLASFEVGQYLVEVMNQADPF